MTQKTGKSIKEKRAEKRGKADGDMSITELPRKKK